MRRNKRRLTDDEIIEIQSGIIDKIEMMTLGALITMVIITLVAQIIIHCQY